MTMPCPNNPCWRDFSHRVCALSIDDTVDGYGVIKVAVPLYLTFGLNSSYVLFVIRSRQFCGEQQKKKGTDRGEDLYCHAQQWPSRTSQVVQAPWTLQIL